MSTQKVILSGIILKKRQFYLTVIKLNFCFKEKELKEAIEEGKVNLKNASKITSQIALIYSN